MKATTAAILLRATRSRLEDNGWLQLGKQEIIALMYAYQETSDKNILALIQMHAKSFMLQVKSGKPVLLGWKTPEELQNVYEAIRTGYKTLDKVTGEFKAEDMLAAKTAHTDAAPQHPSDWLTKALGESVAEDVAKFLQDKKDTKPEDMN